MFRPSSQSILDLGFGSVVQIPDEFGHVAQMSTQAVLDLIKNVSEEGGNSLITMSDVEVDQFCIGNAGTEEVFDCIGKFYIS